ncbi:TlpA family protein disulfide reductase [Corynebacterium sp. TAE3-ERU12]|uniref:TlpA disulfide reductase family protein n=1 Tax=Corynebacterium sp. TAE3-ERU12 TaxID=2849491 RepID=UPI001C45CE68|nr:TlpA disulfide reductase family protein [Corynebacterium sp. TAE3-ERU12]MBV7294552.1 TlpA family protein disulfide reductase [Corynebacterium sp. TAE3-ERU12]
MTLRTSFTRTAAVTAVAAACAATLVGCGADDTVGHDAVAIGGEFEFVSPGGQNQIEYPPEQRQPVGEIYGPSVRNPDKELHLSDYEGQVVVLNAWGQWCGPCRAESDDLQVVHEWMQDDGIGTVLGINVRDNVRQAAADFLDDNGLTFPSIYDPPFVNASAMGGLPASVIPTTVILDRQHRPAMVLLKATDQNELKDIIQKVAAEQ